MRLSLVSILVLSLLVALLPQVQASHMQHCSMMTHASDAQGDPSPVVMDHSSHTMSGHKMMDNAGADCCDTDCQCPASACHGSSVFISLYALSLPQPYFGPLSHMEFFLQAVEPELAYRPPIVA